jgi:hypothetical protein
MTLCVVSTLAAPGFPNFSATPSTSTDAPIATYTVRASALEKLSDFLVRGDRKKAYHFALDEKLWAHAMVIASSIDKEAWKEVVKEFVRTELGNPTSTSALSSGDEHGKSSNGREPLRVAYNFFAGHGAGARELLVPPSTFLALRSQSAGDGLAGNDFAAGSASPASPCAVVHDTQVAKPSTT